MTPGRELVPCATLSHGPKRGQGRQTGCLWSEMTRQGKAGGKWSIVAAWDRMGDSEFPSLEVSRHWGNI